MMHITRYLLRDEADLPCMLDLVRNMPVACRHVVDLPWRLGALDLSEGDDAAFWEDGDGKVVGFAACQYTWAALDFFLLPGSQAAMVATDLFLLEILRRFKEYGATSAIVETDGDRTPARRAYETVGFQPVHTICSTRRCWSSV